MKYFFFCLLFGLIFFQINTNAQTVPNLYNTEGLSRNNASQNQNITAPVNIFTGIPNVSFPLYSYSDQNGLSLNISASYYSGGVRVQDVASTIGLGWDLNCGGVVTRLIRNAPDDSYPNGYMWSSAIGNDIRTDANKYYYDSMDAEQDIFQFNIDGRAGKFYIGKNQQVTVVPLSNLKISYVTNQTSHQITSFKIVSENGTKYLFQDYETTQLSSLQDAMFRSAYAGVTYNSAWRLSKIIAPFSTDTIQFNYSTITQTLPFNFPQSIFVKTSNSDTINATSATGNEVTAIKRISSITFPDKTNIAFVYGTFTDNTDEACLYQIKIRDSVFKKGYLFDYVNRYLSDITPYTSTELDKGYAFFYNSPFFESLPDKGNSIDDWGFYNGIDNHGNAIPSITGIYTSGANRAISKNNAIAELLYFMVLPTGGIIEYKYESNDRLPYTKSSNTLSISNFSGITHNNISLQQVFTSVNQLQISIDKSVSRTGNPPLSGTTNLQLTLKSSDGSTTYQTYTVSLYDLFYTGLKSWSFNQSSGNYLLDVQVTGGGSVTGSMNVNITWENKVIDNSKNAEPIGGLRIFQVLKEDHARNNIVETEEYHYVREDGKSSGFLGDAPKYDYPYRRIEVVNGNNIVTDFIGISSAPVNVTNYAQGSPVGYSRVEVIKGTANKNSGKTVYQFTDLAFAQSLFSSASFPYAPIDIKEWAIGEPKVVSVYDSSGNLKQKRSFNYALHTNLISDKSVKFGRNLTTYNGYANANPPPPKTESYIGQEYYQSTGWVSLDNIYDTAYNTDGSILTTAKSFTYDNYYNIISARTGYDRNKGLQLETRNYYPYNYTIGGAIGKLRDSSILSALISTEQWIIGDANPRIVSGTITDFQLLTKGYIKPSAVYSLETNKPVAQSTIGTFSSSQLNRNAAYFKKQVSFPLYDDKGNLLQSTNAITNQSASQIIDYNNSLVVAKVSNAAYADIAYTSFESNGTGNWTIASDVRNTTSAVTGIKSYNLSNGNVSKTNLNPATSYVLTVWGKNGGSINVNGTSIGASISTHNNWKFYTLTLTSISSVTVSGSGYIDELRLFPSAANMITSTYNPIVGVTSTCDANNTIVYNEYDGLNRIKVVRDNDLNVLKKYNYSDQETYINILPDWEIFDSSTNNATCTTVKTYQDKNFYSDSYNAYKTVSVTDYCGCGQSVYPNYKLVNGVCEQGQRINTSTTYTNGRWQCVYHYHWSDNTDSADKTELNIDPCQVGPLCDTCY